MGAFLWARYRGAAAWVPARKGFDPAAAELERPQRQTALFECVLGTRPTAAGSEWTGLGWRDNEVLRTVGGDRACLLEIIDEYGPIGAPPPPPAPGMSMVCPTGWPFESSSGVCRRSDGSMHWRCGRGWRKNPQAPFCSPVAGRATPTAGNASAARSQGIPPMICRPGWLAAEMGGGRVCRRSAAAPQAVGVRAGLAAAGVAAISVAPRFDGNGTQLRGTTSRRPGSCLRRTGRPPRRPRAERPPRAAAARRGAHPLRLLVGARASGAHARSGTRPAHGGPGNAAASCPLPGSGCGGATGTAAGRRGAKGWGGGPINYQHEALRVAPPEPALLTGQRAGRRRPHVGSPSA